MAFTTSTLISNVTASSPSFPSLRFYVHFEGHYPHVSNHPPLRLKAPAATFTSHQYIFKNHLFSTALPTPQKCPKCLHLCKHYPEHSTVARLIPP